MNHTSRAGITRKVRVEAAAAAVAIEPSLRPPEQTPALHSIFFAMHQLIQTGMTLDDLTEVVRRGYVNVAMSHSNGVQKIASERLGVHRNTLLRIIRGKA